MLRVTFCFSLVAAMVAVAAWNTRAEFPHLLPSKLQTRTTPEEQMSTAQLIIHRIIGNDSHYIRVIRIDPALFKDEKDMFMLTTKIDHSGNRTLEIVASSGVAAVWGFHHYLKHYCDSHVGWQSRRIIIPKPLPPVNETIVAADRFRYYGNVCTFSYSFAWWGIEEWEEHVGWMALNGINLVLAPLGQESAWRRVYSQLGLSDDDIAEHFTGPAFLAWQRMGNVRAWGGPLSVSWVKHSRLIQERIVSLMRSLGIISVLPAFAGHVPPALADLFPNAMIIETRPWNNFSSEYCCPKFVHPNDPLFHRIGESFMRESIRLDGDSHVYSADPFNELSTDLWSTDFVKSVGEAIFSSIRTVDPQAVWLIQNWMFVHDPELWPQNRVREFLHSVPHGRLLVLDLQAEQWPQYRNYEMYYGQPFVWCMLHNFGGTLGMFGDLRPINSEVYVARGLTNSTMVGVGLTMEGINQNYVVYDLMLESAWRVRPVADLNAWVADYTSRRYGCNATSRGWRHLLRSVYSYPGVMRMRGKYVVTRRPSLRITPWAWYRGRDLMEAWSEFVRAAETCSSPGFMHDLVDVTRQALQYRAEQLYMRVLEHMRGSNVWVATRAVAAFIDIMEDMDNVLSTNDDFSLNKWLKTARTATNAGDAALNELNARNQITLWGPNGEIEDYACKQWSGMFRHYYVPRWRLFLQAVLKAMEDKDSSWDERAVQETVREIVTRSFAESDPDELSSSMLTVDISKRLLMKWLVVPGLRDLPYLSDSTVSRGATFSDTHDYDQPSVVVLTSTTPLK